MSRHLRTPAEERDVARAVHAGAGVEELVAGVRCGERFAREAGGPLNVCPSIVPCRCVTAATQVRMEEQDMFSAASVYLSPESVPAARMRQAAPLITMLHLDMAAVAALELALRVGCAWTVVTAKTSAVAHASASVTVALIRVLVVRFMLFPSVSAGGYRADDAAACSRSGSGGHSVVAARGVQACPGAFGFR